jgi:hypothetical protein
MIVIRKPVPGLNAAALTRFVTRAKGATRLKGSVDVLLAGNSDLRALNRRFRGKNRPTDVLSFPAGDSPRKTPNASATPPPKKSRFSVCTVCCTSPDLTMNAITVKWRKKNSACAAAWD